MRLYIIVLVVAGLFSKFLLSTFINGEHIFPSPRALPWEVSGCGSPFKCLALALFAVILFRTLLGHRNVRPTTPARITTTTPSRITTTTPARTTTTTPARITTSTPALTTTTTPARITPTPAPECPARYFLYAESCGRFCYRYESADCISWENARVMCQAEGGDLLAPSECIYPFFKEQADVNTGDCEPNFWLGARRPTDGADFRTVRGDPISNTANFWNMGQPDNSGGMENCLEMRSDASNFKANDNICSQTQGYICQIIK